MEKKIYYINSRNRISGTDSRFSFLLDIKNGDYNKVAVLSCSIPRSYYLFETGKNTFTLTEAGSSLTITVPAGNYSRSSLAVVLGGLLTAASVNSFVYSVSYLNPSSNQNNGHYIFSCSNTVAAVSFTFGLYCYEQLGFNKSATYSFSSGSLESINCVKLGREDTLFIHSDICSNSGDNILQEIFTVDTDIFASILFNNLNLEWYAKNITYTSSNIYSFWLTDEDSVDINLQGLNWQIVLVLYKDTSAEKAKMDRLNVLTNMIRAIDNTGN